MHIQTFIGTINTSHCTWTHTHTVSPSINAFYTQFWWSGGIYITNKLKYPILLVHIIACNGNKHLSSLYAHSYQPAWRDAVRSDTLKRKLVKVRKVMFRIHRQTHRFYFIFEPGYTVCITLASSTKIWWISIDKVVVPVTITTVASRRTGHIKFIYNIV